MKKIVSILLATLLLISVLPFGIFANEAETIEVGTADAFVNAINSINSGEKADNTNITLTSDIDLSGVTNLVPLVSYSGVFDGGNHTITGLSKTIVVANNANESIDQNNTPGGNNYYRWSGEGTFPDGCAEITGSNCWGYCGFATLFVTLSGTVKNLTVKDGSISLNATFNKNNRMDLAYIAGYALNATFDNVHAVGISVTTPSNTTNENQDHMGGAAVFAGRASGNVTFKNCSVDSTSTVDTSKTPRMNAAGILGIYDANGAVNGTVNTANAGDLTFDNCTSEATVTVCTDRSISQVRGDGDRCDGTPGVLYKENIGGNLIIPSTSGPTKVATAAELLTVIEKINAGTLSYTTDITLTADIDLSGVTGWKPFVRYAGVFDGGNHTISGLSQTLVVANNASQSIDANKGYNFYRWSNKNVFVDGKEETATENFCFGYCGFATLFVKFEGTLKNLTVKDGSISLDAQFNKNNRMDLAYIAGYALNATFENVHAVNIDISMPKTPNKAYNTTNENQSRIGGTAIFAGRASGNVTFTNCTVDSASSIDTSNCPRMNGAAILGAYDDNGATDGSINTANAGKLTFNSCSTEATVTVCTNASALASSLMHTGALCDGTPGKLFKENDGGDLYYGTKLSGNGSYTFYYQTRINKDDATAKDYRVICVANTALIDGKTALNATIKFSDGTNEKVFTPATSTVYKSVTASGEGYTDVYTVDEGNIVFGWVITGVPTAYQRDPVAELTTTPAQ